MPLDDVEKKLADDLLMMIAGRIFKDNGMPRRALKKGEDLETNTVADPEAVAHWITRCIPAVILSRRKMLQDLEHGVDNPPTDGEKLVERMMT